MPSSFYEATVPAIFRGVLHTDSLAIASRWVLWMPYGNGGLPVPDCSTLPSSHEGIRVPGGHLRVASLQSP